MADLNMVIKVTGQEQIERAVKSTSNLENRVERLFGALKSGKVTVDQFNKGLGQIERSVNQQMGGFKQTQSAIDAYVKSLRAVDSVGGKTALNKSMAQDMQMAADAAEHYNRALLGVEQSNSSAAVSARVFQAAFAEEARTTREAASAAAMLARENEQLMMKYNPLYASSKQYERALVELDTAHERALISTAQHTIAVDKLTAEYQQFVTGTAGWDNQFVRGGTRAGKSMNRFGMYAQQVGYQVGDFFVQVQSGTNALVAFGQQGTQLAGLLPGLAGAIVGIGISVGTTLALAWQRSRGEVKETKDALEDFVQTLDASRSSLETYLTPLAELSEEFGEFGGSIRRLSLFVAKQELADALGQVAEIDLSSVNAEIAKHQELLLKLSNTNLQLAKAQQDMGAGLPVSSKFTGGLEVIAETLREQMSELQETLGLNVVQIGEFERAFKRLGEAQATGGAKDIAAAAEELLRILEGSTDEAGVLEDSIRSIVAPLRDVLESAAALAETQKDANTQSTAISDSFMRSSSFLEQMLAYAGAISESYVERKAELERENVLLQMSLKYGKDSLAVKRLQAQYDEEALRAELRKDKIYGSQQDKLVRIWKNSQDITSETDRATAAAQALLGVFNAMVGVTAAVAAATASILANSRKTNALAKIDLAEATGEISADQAIARQVMVNVGDISGEDPIIQKALEPAIAEAIALQQETARVNAELDKIRDANKGSGGSKEETQTLEEYVAALEERLLKERELIGLSEEVRAIEEYRIDLVEDLRDKYPEMGTAAIEAAAAEIAAIKQVNDEMEKKQAKWDEFSEFVGNEFGSALSSIIDGSKTVGEAFGDMVTSILNEVLRLLIIEPLVNSITNALKGIGGGGGLFGLFSAQGNVFTSSGVTPFAKGGVVSGPTVFPFANGIGLMGEAGPEAIMPLKRTPSGDLGVIAQGGGGGGAVNVTVNNYGKEDASVSQQPNGDIVVTVGRAVAQDIANGGPTYQAMKKTFGLSQTIKRRG